jgi:hypothetical protein
LPRLKPGLAFWIVCDLGFAVGLMTHHRPKIGHLVWIAQPMFDDAPTVDDVAKIDQWRWPVFFPLGAALHRGIVTKIGDIAIPPTLQSWPLMRGGNRQMGWRLVNLAEPESLPLTTATDPTLPIYSIVNDTRLKEMIVSGWRPEDAW